MNIRLSLKIFERLSFKIFFSNHSRLTSRRYRSNTCVYFNYLFEDCWFGFNPQVRSSSIIISREYISFFSSVPPPFFSKRALHTRIDIVIYIYIFTVHTWPRNKSSQRRRHSTTRADAKIPSCPCRSSYYY